MSDIVEDLLDEVEDDWTDETEEERLAREELEVVLDPESQGFVNSIIEKLLLITDEISGHPLYPYQRPFAARIFESLILNDGATITALFARQSGKTETVANVIATAMIMFPRLAPIFPQYFGKFAEGVKVGAFAPVDEQADNLYKRIVDTLTSERAIEFMLDDEIDDQPQQRGKELSLKKCRSMVRKQTAHPRASIEGRTYHIILIDECQDADERVINKSIYPMRASTNGTVIFTGTPTYTKGVFYRQIQQNKRRASYGRRVVNHFEADWKACAKANPNYGKSIKGELGRIGEDSDEFKLSYKLMWLLDKGMFTTTEQLDALGDKSMPVIHSWHKSPVVVGIDPARKQDSTIVTVVWVGWDMPDENGYLPHRVLNWLDLSGMDWESQFYAISDFLKNYSVMYAGVDEGGMGDLVIDRMRNLCPWIEWIPLGSSRPEQSKRWKHLGELLRRGMIGWPAHAKTRRLKTYRRFRQQMEELEIKFEQQHVLAAAPNEADAHDDYADSLAMACILAKDSHMPTVEVSNNFFYAR